jgi:uncharacterized protein (DUF2267 family)
MRGNGHGYANATLVKTDLLLKDIEHELEWPMELREHSYRVLRAVLHALRDRLTVQESAEFAAQLPTLVRGIYFEGWRPEAVPVKTNVDEFMERVRRECQLEVKGGTPRLVQVTLRALHRHITPGEWKDVKSSMPKDFESVLP